MFFGYCKKDKFETYGKFATIVKVVDIVPMELRVPFKPSDNLGDIN